MITSVKENVVPAIPADKELIQRSALKTLPGEAERRRAFLIENAREIKKKGLGYRAGNSLETYIKEVEAGKHDLHFRPNEVPFEPYGALADAKTSLEIDKAFSSPQVQEIKNTAGIVENALLKSSWKEKLSGNLRHNFSREASPAQMIFSWGLTSMGASMLLSKAVGLLAPAKEKTVAEDGTVTQARAVPLKQDLVSAGVGTAALLSGLFVKIGKGANL